jgi:3-phenylpropionate/trans-cinnamate dioxygenase ferredoxin reductase subunit
MEPGIVIIGGGLAGAVAVESYRKAGGTRPVSLVSADTALPVHRPPLSKEYLRGDESLDNVYVHPAGFYAEHEIEVRLDTRADSIDRDAGAVVLKGGERIPYDTLVLATGARSRRLPVPGGDLPGVFYLRSLRSAEELRAAYDGTRQAVIIGGGFIGMEVAASLTQRGVSCTVVEMAPRMWSSIVPPVVSEFIQKYFSARGVTFRFGAGVSSIEGTGRAERVLLANGEVLDADLVVAGVGAMLNTELAEAAGLEVQRGVVVDEHFRTFDPSIYAIGDIALFPDPIGGRLHLEHWDNALHQGRALGQTLAGSPAPFGHVAYFFSDLFDLSLNMVGYPSGWDQVVQRGDSSSGRFTVAYLRDGIVRAALMVNDDEHFDGWTQAVSSRQRATDALSDPDVQPVLAVGEPR